MDKIVIVLRTFNRLEAHTERARAARRVGPTAPGTCNYPGQTLRNLERAGVFASLMLHSLHVVDSGSLDENFFIDEVLPFAGATLHRSTEMRSPNQNAGEALRIGAATGAPWVMFCEDDIDVVGDFLDGVAAWLEKHARDDRRLYSFGSAYPGDGNAPGALDVNIESFYGTTCYVVRNVDAAAMAAYIEANPLYSGGRFHGEEGVPVAHDLHWHQFSRLAYPGIDFFSVSSPSFVQHVGVHSGISGRTHLIEYSSWPGRDWRYRG